MTRSVVSLSTAETRISARPYPWFRKLLISWQASASLGSGASYTTDRWASRAFLRSSLVAFMVSACTSEANSKGGTGSRLSRHIAAAGAVAPRARAYRPVTVSNAIGADDEKPGEVDSKLRGSLSQ